MTGTSMQRRKDTACGKLTCRLNAKTATASSGTGNKLSKPMMRSHSSSTSPTARWPAKAVMIQGRARCRGGQPRPLRCWATSPSLSYTRIQALAKIFTWNSRLDVR